MFGKKKKEITESLADNKMRELYNEWGEASETLRLNARKVYIKAESLKVYDLTTPDGKAAKTDLDNAKYQLRCSIGHYDSIIAEIKHYYKEHHEKMQINWSTDFLTSHERIELEISTFFKK